MTLIDERSPAVRAAEASEKWYSTWAGRLAILAFLIVGLDVGMIFDDGFDWDDAGVATVAVLVAFGSYLLYRQAWKHNLYRPVD